MKMALASENLCQPLYPTPICPELSCVDRAGSQQIVFLERGPLYLVGVSRTGEPPAAVHLALDLLHAQLLCLLTREFQTLVTRNPRYDSRRLLGTLNSLVCVCVALQAFIRCPVSSACPAAVPANPRFSDHGHPQPALRLPPPAGYAQQPFFCGFNQPEASDEASEPSIDALTLSMPSCCAC